MMNERYKLVVYVPQTHLEQVRIAMSNAGAGKVGNYDNCAFMTSGIGTFRPLKGAKPFQGGIGKVERIGEARIEATVQNIKLKKVIAAIRKVHPYEEAVIDIFKLENI